MAKKYQIFVSSTFRDLVDERQDTIRSILDLGHIPAGMELFPAADTEQLEYIKKVIDEFDYYILIMGGRYGSLDEEGVSFTEREYDYAVETGKIVLAFPHGDLTSLPISKSDTADRMQRNLSDFRIKVMTGRLVREWSTREQLESLVVKAIVRATADYPAVGWVRGDTAASETLLQQINDLRNDNESLKARLNQALSANKPSIKNLADLSDTVTLNFYRKPYRSGHQYREDKSFKFSWGAIFVAIAVNIGASKSTGLIGSYIDKYRKNRDKSDVSYSIIDNDAAMVKTQLSALGLINVFVSKTVNDGGLHEFMTLTELGKRRLTEILAVRKADIDPSPQSE